MSLQFGDIAAVFDAITTEGQINFNNWTDRKDIVTVSGVMDPDEIAHLFSIGHTVIKLYLRTTPQPDK